MDKKNIKIITTSFQSVFSPIGYFLRLGHEIFGRSKSNYTWLKQENVVFSPIDDSTDSEIEKISKLIIKEKIDILGVSIYAWNNIYINRICARLKELNNNIIIVAGGPDIDPHKNKNFFKTHPFFDYAIYGDGEKAFALLLDYLAGYNVNLINVVFKDGTIYPHEVFKDKEILNYSPYLLYKEELKKDINKFKKTVLKKFKSNRPIYVTWETTKGCPYKCSFCDWSSGLHNKVRIWGLKKIDQQESVPNWKKELDLFSELKIDYIFWTNPNVGLTRQDEEIVNYWCELKEKGLNPPLVINLQLSKLNKEFTYKLWSKFYDVKLVEYLKLDLQELDKEVLKNIDRPQIDWEEHKILIEQLLTKYPELKFNKSSVNFIWGLPGQTPKHFDTAFLEILSLGLFPIFYIFEILPNTPANEFEYQKKFKVETQEVYMVNKFIPTDFLEYNDEIKRNYCNKSKIVVSTYSLDKKSWYATCVKKAIYSMFAAVINKDPELYIKNFYKFNDIIDDLYEKFLVHKIIFNTTTGGQFFNAGFNEKHLKNIKKILYELYKPNDELIMRGSIFAFK